MLKFSILTLTQMNLKLRRFNMKWIKDDSVVIFIGRRCTGKSVLLKDLLYNHRDMPVGTVMSATEGANHFYSKILPSIFIHDDYTPEIVDNFLKRQKMMVKRIESKNPQYSNVDPRAFIVLDDCMYDSSWTKDKNIRSLFMNGRHFKILFLITMQYALGIPPNLRTNVDYVFILRDTYQTNRRKLYEHYCGMFPSFEIFCQVMDQCTQNFECLVIHNNAQSSRIEDMVFWYKAEMHDDFRMGADIIWEHHDRNYYDSDEDDDADFNSKYSKKKAKNQIAVKKYKD